MDKAQGIPFRDGGVTGFFVMLAVGITMEDLVQWGFQRLQHPEAQRNPKGENDKTRSATFSSRPSPRAYKILGYAWVFLFLSWTTPLWLYPRLRRELRGDSQDSGLVAWMGGFFMPAEGSVVI